MKGCMNLPEISGSTDDGRQRIISRFPFCKRYSLSTNAIQINNLSANPPCSSFLGTVGPTRLGSGYRDPHVFTSRGGCFFD
mmetsp:Transcript_300/g.593  ORF Transcript_300/g.593 Transcript_300/m.593 type:complete len:81 (+) Transcript_300:133-375(+)